MKYLVGFLFAIIVLAMLGCSGAVGDPIAVNEPAVGADSVSSHMLWGLWQCAIDPDAGTLEVVPMRLGDIHLNALHFLEPPPHLNLFVHNLQKNGNILDCDVSIRHPFLGLKQYTGFDACGIFITHGSMAGFTNSALIMTGTGDTRLLNPDGYTRWWNPAEFPVTGTMFGYQDGLLGNPDEIQDYNCTLNGYKMFCDEIENPGDPLTVLPVASRCVFSNGTVNTRHYTIEIAGNLVFNYAVDANWKFPEGNPPWVVPDSFPPGANRPEAWNISVTEVENTLWNDGSGTPGGGGLSLDIALWDHFNAAHNTLYVESTGNFAPVGPVAPAIVSTYGASFEIDIASATPDPGSIDIFITAECEQIGYQNFLPGEPVAAYFIHTAKVGTGSGNLPPVAVAEVITLPPYSPGDPVEFDASGSYDTDGFIVSYEWDFDFDLIYGDPYDSGTDENPTKIFNEAGTYTIDVRVTDNEGATDTLDNPLVIQVYISDYIWVDDDAVEPYLGTFDQPFPTIEMGVEAAENNYPEASYIMVKDGTYAEEVLIQMGNVILEGYSTPAPLIESPAGSVQDLVILASSADSVTIKHFQLKPMTDMRGIYASGSNQVIDDIEFIDNPGGPTCSRAIYVGSWSGIGNVINNVRVNGYHKSDIGFIYAAGADIQVTNCVLLNITFEGASTLQVLSFNGYTSGLHPDLLIAKNVIGHITQANEIDDTEWVRAVSGSDIEGATIRNNLIFDIVNKHTGGWTWGMDLDDAMDVIVEHNTINDITGPRWIYALEVGDWNTDPSGVIHRDHIVTKLRTTGPMQSWRWAYLGNWNDTPLPVDYSCAYDVGNAFYNGIDDVVEGVGFIYTNPQFMDVVNDDYRVTPGSPASGTAHDGTDMGAYGGSDPLTWLPN